MESEWVFCNVKRRKFFFYMKKFSSTPKKNLFKKALYLSQSFKLIRTIFFFKYCILWCGPCQSYKKYNTEVSLKKISCHNLKFELPHIIQAPFEWYKVENSKNLSFDTKKTKIRIKIGQNGKNILKIFFSPFCVCVCVLLLNALCKIVQ